MAFSTDEIRQNYKELFEYSSDYIFIIDINDIILDVNDNFLNNPEFSSLKILNTNISKFLVTQDDFQESNKVKTLDQNINPTKSLIYRLDKRDGNPLLLKVEKIPIKKKNQLTAFLGIGHDITKQIEMENTIHETLKYNKELNETKERFRNLFKGNPYYSTAWQKVKGDFLLFEYNNIAERDSMFNLKELLGKSSTEMSQLEVTKRIFNENLNSCFEKKTNITDEAKFYVKTLNRKLFILASYCYVPPDLVLCHVENITKRKRAIQQLKESEERFRRLFKGSPHFTVIWQKVKDDFIIIDFNNNSKEINKGILRNTLGKKASVMFLKDQYRPDLIENLNICFDEKKNYSIDTTLYIDFIDRERDLNIIYTYIPPDLVVSYSEDITKRKRAERKIKESEENYRTIIENTKEGYYEVDLKGNYTLVNNAYCKLLEFTYNEIVGQNYRKFTTTEIAKKTFNAFNLVYKTGIEQTSFDYLMITNSGRLKYGDSSINLVYDMDGNKVGFRGFIKETTEKKLAEQKLIQTEKRFRSLFKGAPNFTIAWQKSKDDFILIDYNEGAEKISKGGIRERIGQTVSQMYIKELNRPDLVEDLIICFETKKNFTKEVSRYIDFLDTERDLRIKYTYVPPDLVLNHIEDITEKRQAEQKLKKSEEKYRNAYERENFYKDLFAHDMNNILQGMLSSLELCNLLLSKSNQNESIFEFLDTLKKQIQRGSNLVKNVRTFSQLQDSELKLEKIIVNDLLEKAISIVKKSSPTKTINVQIENFNDIIAVQSDEFLLDVFENILFNAVKHNENNIIEILIKLSEVQDGSMKSLKIEFIDNGIGIDDSCKQSIFKRGYKEDRSVAGIGLGLSLVYNILDRYSATIRVKNRVPEDHTQGSNFIIQFPLLF